MVFITVSKSHGGVGQIGVTGIVIIRLKEFRLSRIMTVLNPHS